MRKTILFSRSVKGFRFCWFMGNSVEFWQAEASRRHHRKTSDNIYLSVVQHERDCSNFDGWMAVMNPYTSPLTTPDKRSTSMEAVAILTIAFLLLVSAQITLATFLWFAPRYSSFFIFPVFGLPMLWYASRRGIKWVSAMLVVHVVWFAEVALVLISD